MKRLFGFIVTAYLCIGLCACNGSNDASNGIDKYEDQFELIGMNTSLVEKVEYQAIEDGSIILGYPMTMEIKVLEEIPDDGLISVAKDFLRNEMQVNKNNVGECKVIVKNRDLEAFKSMIFRFATKERDKIAIYQGENLEESKPRITENDWVNSEEVYLALQTGSDDAEYQTPEDKEVLSGSSLLYEMKVLFNGTPDKLANIIKEYMIKEMQAAEERGESELAVERKVAVYQFGGLLDWVTIRYKNKDRKEIVFFDEDSQKYLTDKEWSNQLGKRMNGEGS